MINNFVNNIKERCRDNAELDKDDDDVIINTDSIKFANCDDLIENFIGKLSKQISEYWYNELHGKYRPIEQKQRLKNYINNLK